MSEDCVNNKRIFVALLAAGNSKRFGSTKQLAQFDGETMVRRAARVAKTACEHRTLLIVGNEWPAVTTSAAEHCSFFTVNEHPADGIGSSIALASRLLATRADAILVMLVDQVRVTSEHLDKLISTWSGDPGEIVASAFSRSSGPPALFASDTFADLARLSGDRGAHSLLDDARFKTVRVPCADAAFDVDTVADLERLR